MLLGIDINVALKLRDGGAGCHGLRSHLEYHLVRVLGAWGQGGGAPGARGAAARMPSRPGDRRAGPTDQGMAALGSRVSPRRRLRNGEPRARLGSSGPAALQPSRCYSF